nr:reverse transcriptase domain-containing protein [Tanacetum cinerariifolium]
MLLVAPPSPDYIPGPEEPQTPPAPHEEDEHEPMFIQPHDPNFVPEPIYPRYIPLEDEHILLAEEQPLPPVVSPTAESPGYVAESDPEEDPEEYEDDETEDGPVDYPMDEGDDGDDDDGNSSGDDADDEDEDEEDEEEEEEEEHLASADAAVIIPTDDLVSPPEGAEPAAISFPPEAEVERLLAMPTPSPSPLTSLSPPFTGEHLARCTAPSTLPSTPLPPPLHMPPPIDHRDDILRLRCHLIRVPWMLKRDDEGLERLGMILGILGQIMAPVTRQGPSAFPNNTNPNNKTPESVQAMIDQVLLRNSTNGDGSHSSHEDNRRNMQTACPCFYADFMKCQPLNFKGTEGVAGLTRWIEKMESVFQISGCAVENQVKFATCTLLDGEIKKLEIELWNLKVKENNVSAYTKHFQELTLICTKFVADETEKINKYVSRLPDNIYGSVKASKPKTLDETIELANELMDQTLHTYAERQSNNKRKADENNGANPKGNGCFECGATRHFKRDCPKLKNKVGEKVNAPGWVYVVGNAEKIGNASRDSDSNVITSMFLLNNCYASILFDTGADRSFISIAFSSLINIVPTLLGNSYDVELADGKIVRVDTIMRGCTLNFLGHPFNIDLMPVELGSLDVIIDMDWLRRCHVVIVCEEKLVRIPYGNETLNFHGNESNNGRDSRLTVISCLKLKSTWQKDVRSF